MSVRTQRRIDALTRRRAMHGKLVGRALLEPSGAHMLEIGIDAYPVRLTMGPSQVEQLRGLIAAYERTCARIDNGQDLQFPRTEGLDP